MIEKVTRAPAECMCRPCTAVEAILIITLINDIVWKQILSIIHLSAKNGWADCFCFLRREGGHFCFSFDKYPSLKPIFSGGINYGE